MFFIKTQQIVKKQIKREIYKVEIALFIRYIYNNKNLNGGGFAVKTLPAKTNAGQKMKKLANKSLKPSILQDIKKNPWLYMLCMPAILFFVLFSYIPMAGLYIAFVDYRPLKGIW